MNDLTPPIGPSMAVTPATPMEMLSRALMAGAAPETLEKLLALQERWEKSMARKAFDRALAAARGQIPTIKKNKTVRYGTTTYTHEDLAEIERTVVPPLSEHGLSYRFRTEVVDKMIIVTCVLSHRDGHYEENSLPGPADTSGSKNAIQSIGSTVTYLQRYTIKAALGLAASDDDDGRTAGANGKTVYMPPAKDEQGDPLSLEDMAREAARHGRDVVKTFFAGQDEDGRKRMLAIKVELDALVDEAERSGDAAEH